MSMAYTKIVVLWSCCLISTDASSEVNGMMGDEYLQMSYIPNGPLLSQLSVKSKFLCAAQCTRLYPECNIAVFDYSINSQCSLYYEMLTPTNLVVSSNTIVYHFRRNYTIPIANTYGSLDDNGVDDQRNNYVVFNTDQSVIFSGFVSTVSIKFCSLPTSASPVIWIYAFGYTGFQTYYVPNSMYTVPPNQINTNATIQEYTFPPYQVNISATLYMGVGFGSTTGGSPCQVIPDNSCYTNTIGGADLTYLYSIRSAWPFNSQSHGISVSYTVLTYV